MKTVDNIIFLSAPLNSRAGGPRGYIANLKKALETGCSDGIAFVTARQSFLGQFLRGSIIKLMPRLLGYKAFDKIISFLRFRNYAFPDKRSLSETLKTELDGYSFKTITCHNCIDAQTIINYVKEKKLAAKVLLMSHTPSLPSEEYYEMFLPYNKTRAQEARRRWQDFEKKVFKSVDVLLAPSEESFENYALAEYFKNLLTSKSVKFIPTGCDKITPKETKQQLRRKHKIKTPFVIGYMGRHNYVRGYDILKSAALEILQKRDDITFLIAGQKSSQILPLKHKRWVELGWQEPSEVLYASDIFILPGRQAFFDLILLEAMSAGVPVLASNVSGNKAVYRQTRSIELFSDAHGCAQKVCAFLDLSKDERNAAGIKTLKAYENNYSLNAFALNYIELIKEINGE